MSSYFCIVCFYDSTLDGKFGVDYMFRDMKMAIQTLKMYNDINEKNDNQKCWPVIYASKLPYVEDEEYYVYLDPSKKRMHISAYPVEDSPFNGRRIALPIVNTSIPEANDVKSMCGL